jgi:hypothetical protein
MALGAMAMLVLAAVPMLGNTQSAASETPAFRCYCECESHGSICPKKMCDLPKYEKRWWATSCHKREVSPAASQSPVKQPSGASHTHEILNAKK